MLSIRHHVAVNESPEDPDGPSDPAWQMEKRHRGKAAQGWSERSDAAQWLTEVFLLVFRLNGALLTAGDRLVEPTGLTSAKWQVLGAIALAPEPVSVPEISVRMGISKQAVQRHVNRFHELEIVRREPNPLHLRSPKYGLTPAGKQLFAQVDGLHQAWVEALSDQLRPHVNLAKARDALEAIVLAVTSTPVPAKK